MASIAHLSNGPHKVALVSLGLGGTGIYYSCCSISGDPRINADAFERCLRETELLFTTMSGVEQFEGAYVVDKRPAIARNGASCSVNSPMLDATLPEGTSSPLNIKSDNLAAMAPGLVGTFQALALQKLAEPKWRGLDSVCTADYVNHWRSLGARIGRIRDRTVVWEPISHETASPE